ncbi:MAG: Dabb family protein, partial [Microbacterium gubbeenense]|uniref:Dabb family protein n=2 Tax=Microbacterium gubbeenense TaxID=159896 RepID=UPI003F96FE8D
RSLYAGAMIRHIVMFGVDADNDTDRNAKITEAAVRLEKLVGVVPGLRSMTVGANGVDIEGNYDFALVADLDDADALGVYANHPAHLEVSSFIGSFKTTRAAIDIEL